MLLAEDNNVSQIVVARVLEKAGHTAIASWIEPLNSPGWSSAGRYSGDEAA